ncbi:hypothetical protein CAPTEDRAFT_194710 [Capitella teleta]|uniref:G-protein coupled receptors family 1 profile domain-containing protein n=1 Tax=Capitella teleta TaxID=283909 RepID=R7VCG1_CAPTE|nr:hypothetical protein CAPTEDRAFT_194710 [Capitella teleta]|eukprot:ELU16227.1 hypothetical protein CAPTEDRAFT_194710 [Capitella teleta]
MTYTSTGPMEEVSISALDVHFNNTTSLVSVIDTQPTNDISTWYPWALLLVYLILPIGFLLNLITAVAYIKSPLLSRGKPVHQFIFNMTLSDLVSSLIAQPFVLFQYTEAGARFIMTRKMPCIASILGMTIAFDSTLTALLLVTCERLLAIASPLQHMHRVTRKTARVAIVTTWTLVTVKSSVLFFWNTWVPNAACILITVSPNPYGLYVYNPSIYTCVGLVVLLNILLGVAVAVAKRKAGTMQASLAAVATRQRQMKSTQSELKIVKIVFLIVSVLFVSWIPNNSIANVIFSYAKRNQAAPYHLLIAFHMTRGMMVIGVVADPLIYFLKNTQCREAVLKLFGRAETSKNNKRQQCVYTLDPKTATTECIPVDVYAFNLCGCYRQSACVIKIDNDLHHDIDVKGIQ